MRSKLDHTVFCWECKKGVMCSHVDNFFLWRKDRVQGGGSGQVEGKVRGGNRGSREIQVQQDQNKTGKRQIGGEPKPLLGEYEGDTKMEV